MVSAVAYDSEAQEVRKRERRERKERGRKEREEGRERRERKEREEGEREWMQNNANITTAFGLMLVLMYVGLMLLVQTNKRYVGPLQLQR